MFAVNPSDYMYATAYKNIENNQVYIQYYIKDITTGQVFQTAISVGNALNGHTAEWITEVPTLVSNGSSYLPPLAIFSQFSMTDAEVVSGSTTLLVNQIQTKTSYHLDQYTMTGADKANTGLTGNGKITFTFEGNGG